MELQTIVERYAEAFEHVDPNAHNPNYQPGMQALTERQLLALVDGAWDARHPQERVCHATEVPYPTLNATTKIDHVFSTDSLVFEGLEWGIEVKRLQFAGNNGGQNDYQVAKVLSPYLKDRGLLHDALRLQAHGFTRRIAVIGYGFDYDLDSLAHAASLHSSGTAAATVTRIRQRVHRDGPLHHRPLIEFADAIIRLRGWTKGPRAEAPFEAWRHPAGGRGVVFGWEIRRPELEDGFDPRHPW